MNKLYIFVLSLIGFIGCNTNLNSAIKEIRLYDKGIESRVENKSYDFEVCCSNIARQYTLLITEDEIEKIKQNESGIEFIFKNNIKYTFEPIHKTKKFDRAFIPLSGDYTKILFLGDKDGYGAYTPYGLVNCKNRG